MKWFGNISAFQRVILGLALGIVLGVFVGEPTGHLSIIGDIYIRLLQMTVLPYVLVSLVCGLGSLDMQMAKRIGTRGGAMILTLWSVALAALICLPLAYPDWTSAAFFSTSLVTTPEPFDPLALYVPSNPFYVLGHGVVPAVVLFGVALGVALITVDNKEGLLRGLGSVSDALMRIASFVGKLAPIGIFAISATAAGTLRVEELGRLQVFLWVYLVAWTLLTILVVPAVVAAATPFRYRDVLVHAREAMVTAFATGTVLVVLPMIAERVKTLLAEQGMDNVETDTAVDVLVPTAYSFPSVGTLLGLGFVLFAAWYVGSPISLADYPAFVSVGALVAFGSMAVAIPYMLDFFALPSDLFQLYLLGSVVTGRFATGLAAMHGVAVCLLGACAVIGRVSYTRLLRTAAIGTGVVAASMVLLGVVLSNAIPYEYGGDKALVTMELSGPEVDAVQTELPPPLENRQLARPRLEVVRERGDLRAGYLADRLPFAYRSDSGQVIGHDVDLLHRLADDLGVTLTFVLTERDAGFDALEKGSLDLLIGGLGVTPQIALEVAFTRSYIDQALGLVVADHRRAEFTNLEDVQDMAGLRIAVTSDRHYRKIFEELLPQAQLVALESRRDFFRDPADIDALAMSAQAGSAWTLIYPNFSVVVPSGMRIKGSTAFALPRDVPDMTRYLDTWLELAEKNGVTEQLFNHWILGRGEQRLPPRWSVMSNMLGWGQEEPNKED